MPTRTFFRNRCGLNFPGNPVSDFATWCLDNIFPEEITINKPPVLFSETQRKLKSISKRYQSDVIAYWGAYNSSMAINDLVVLNELLKRKDKSNLTSCIYL